MPQENKKRGRRMKRKHDEDAEPDVQESSKRRKSTDDALQADYLPVDVQDESLDAAFPSKDRAFFGMLDEEEQEYFKRADDMLEMNSFGDEEERKLFLANVYREAEGKELKIAQSQSCSRLMERLIQLSTTLQLKQLFQAFSGNFIHLVSHRFASHCCEALFMAAAPAVTEELLAPPNATSEGGATSDQVYVSMENLFLHTLAELEGSIGFLMTEQYASHVLRVMLLALAGEPLDQSSNKHLVQSKRKEGVTIQGVDGSGSQASEKTRSVPDSFTEALERLISGSVAGLDTEKLRALATHPNGSPTLQLLLQLELTKLGKQRAKDEKSLVRQLLPDDPITAESGSGVFINGLVYDPIGSHLVEQIVQHAPGKLFKNLNKNFFRDRLASFARNEVAGYVVCRVLERMSKEDLYDAHERLIPVLPGLLERNRTVVVRTLIERCAVRDIDTQAVAIAMETATGGSEGFNIKTFLKTEQPVDQSTESRGTPHDSVQSDDSAPAYRPSEPAKVHFNLLAQAMLLVPGALSALILDALVNLDPPTLIAMSKDPIVSRTLQTALTTKNASIIQRRKFIQHFYGSIGNMALDKAASHVVDCIWEGTHGLAFIRERIAEELAENETQLRDTSHGRAVWKNWKMDMYKRKRADWIKQSKFKASNDGFQSFAELDQKKKDEDGAAQKTPLQLARERHAQKKAAQESKAKGKSRPETGANSEAVRTNGTAATASS